MLLDIGAKTSNLLFFEKGKVFSRSINLGANSITQDFANESKLKFDNAEKLKIDEGFVSLGGAYEEPENANQAAISKIARQDLTVAIRGVLYSDGNCLSIYDIMSQYMGFKTFFDGLL